MRRQELQTSPSDSRLADCISQGITTELVLDSSHKALKRIVDSAYKARATDQKQQHDHFDLIHKEIVKSPFPSGLGVIKVKVTSPGVGWLCVNYCYLWLNIILICFNYFNMLTNCTLCMRVTSFQ